jgi:F-type H+-transporting ATPase subunit delta
MTNRVAARRYARALFDVSLKEADPVRVGRELDAFQALVAAHADLARLFANPAVPAPRKRAVVDALLAREALAAPLAKLLQLLAERDRLVLLGEIAEAYGERLLDHQRVVRATVTSAVALPADRVEALRRSLAAATGRDVRLETAVDPSIVGGVVAKVGSLVFDGSVTRQLARLEDTLAAG